MKHEKRGIYNATFNDKKAAQIKTDIEFIEEAVINELIYYVKGWHNIRRDKGVGAEHIKLHLEKGSQSEITIEELVNLGNSIREYLKIFKEPYLEDANKSRRVFEWQNENGTRFRVAIDKHKEEGLIPPLSPFVDAIISFYSDRNLNERMQFKNPKVEQYYQNISKVPESTIAEFKAKAEEFVKDNPQPTKKKSNNKGMEL